MPGQSDDSQSPPVDTLRPSSWMRQILMAAAFYNIAWGAFAILSPLTVFRWCGFDPLPTYPSLRCKRAYLDGTSWPGFGRQS